MGWRMHPLPFEVSHIRSERDVFCDCAKVRARLPGTRDKVRLPSELVLQRIVLNHLLVMESSSLRKFGTPAQWPQAVLGPVLIGERQEFANRLLGILSDAVTRHQETRREHHDEQDAW